MTQDKCAEIRSWWKVYFETIIGDKDNLVQLSHAQRLALQVPVLLDKLEAETKRADKAELKFTQAALDCFHAVKRAEVLEQTIKTRKICSSCSNYLKSNTEEPCLNCNYIGGENKAYQFDEARFTGTIDAEVDENGNQ